MRAPIALPAWLAALLIFALPVFASAQSSGSVTITGLTGSVTANGQRLTNGQRVAVGSEVRTAAASSAVLVFSTGSTVALAANTTLVVQEFRQSAFNAPVGTTAGSLRAEPSTSRTRLKLDNGQIAGDVKRLNQGSSFEVETPAGIAGVLGTKISISVLRNTDGSVTVTWNVSEGSIGFTPVGSVTLTGDQAATVAASLAAGESVTFDLSRQGDRFVATNVNRGSLSAAAAQGIADSVARAATLALAVQLSAGEQTDQPLPDLIDLDLLPDRRDTTPGAGGSGPGGGE